MKFILLILFIPLWFLNVKAGALDLSREYMYDGYYAKAHQLIIKSKPREATLKLYQWYMLYAEFNYLTQNIEYFKYYTDSAEIIIRSNEIIPKVYLAEVYRNYSKYHHFHAMPLYSVPYADSALFLVKKYKSSIDLIDIHTIYFAKAAAERNNDRSIVQLYFDSAFNAFRSYPYKKAELFRSLGNFYIDQITRTNVSMSFKKLAYQNAIGSFNSAENIIKIYYPKNRSQLGYIYALKGLASHLLGENSIIAKQYLNSAILFFETSNELSYSIIHYIVALTWKSMSSTKSPSIDELEENIVLLKRMIPQWELWVNRNINSSTFTLKYIYSNSPLNLIASNYAKLYKHKQNNIYADSFFYYTEKIKGYSIISDISNKTNFNVLNSIKICQDSLKPNEAFVSYFNDYAEKYFALLIQKNNYYIIDLDRSFLGFISTMEKFHNNKSDFNSFKSYAYSLYVYLFKPIQLKLNKNISHITISPSIFSGNVNFESLIEDTTLIGFKNQDYLFKKYTFNYQVSLSLSAYLAKQQSNKNRALVFTPKYKNTDKNELPFLLEQANSLSIYNYNMYNGGRSNPTMFMLNSQYAKYIHVAGHSSVVKDDYGSNYSMLFNNNHEGIVKLSVSDLIKIKLDADLVVLALCETGIGNDLSNEANLNMAYYFTRVGAKSCVYGINKLEDKSTASILADFYYYLNQGIAKDDALHRAKLKYLEVERFDEEYSPIFWSSLAIQGNIKPIYFDAKNKPNVYLFLIAECIFTGLVCLGLFGKNFTVK